MASAWRDALWGYENRYEDDATPPTAGAALWWCLAYRYPDEMGEWLEAWDKI